MSIKVREMLNDDAVAFLQVHHAAVRGIAAKDYPPEVGADAYYRRVALNGAYVCFRGRQRVRCGELAWAWFMPVFGSVSKIMIFPHQRRDDTLYWSAPFAGDAGE